MDSCRPIANTLQLKSSDAPKNGPRNMGPTSRAEGIPGIAHNFQRVGSFRAHNFAPYHLAYESGHAKQIGAAFRDGLLRNDTRVMADLQILPRPGVIRQRPEGNARAISALLF